MRRAFCGTALAGLAWLMAVSAAVAEAPATYVVDRAHVVAPEVVAEINRRDQQLAVRNEAFYVVTVEALPQGADWYGVATRLLGNDDPRGVVFLIDTSHRHTYLSVDPQTEQNFGIGTLREAELRNAISERFHVGDFKGGLLLGMGFVEDAANPKPQPPAAAEAPTPSPVSIETRLERVWTAGWKWALGGVLAWWAIAILLAVRRVETVKAV